MAAAPLVFITGASSGLGQAMAQRFYQAGYRLALVARRVDSIQAWADQQHLAPNRYAVFGADVGDADSIVAAARRCIAEFGLPDVVIANAGVSYGVSTERREDIDHTARLFAINNLGVMATFHPFVAPMRERGHGQLIGIASVAGIRGLPGHSAYSASKAAVIAYCESLRGELRGTGVRVGCILPGYIATPMTAKNKYPMPFLMQADAFADRAFASITRGDSYRVIPWQMAIVARALKLLPDALFDRAFAQRGRKAGPG